MIKSKLKISLLFLTVFLSSCLNYTQITTIKTDKSGKMFIHYWMKIDPNIDSLFLNRLGIFNKDSLKKSFNASFIEQNFANSYKDFNDSTIHSQIEFEFTSFDSLNKLQFFKHSNMSIRDGAEKTKIFSQFIQPLTSNFGFYDSTITIVYTYYLPGKIISHNADEISRNRLTWLFNIDELGTGRTITAKYIPFRLKETPHWIYYLTILVIIIVFIFLIKKK